MRVAAPVPASAHAMGACITDHTSRRPCSSSAFPFQDHAARTALHRRLHTFHAAHLARLLRRPERVNATRAIVAEANDTMVLDMKELMPRDGIVEAIPARVAVAMPSNEAREAREEREEKRERQERQDRQDRQERQDRQDRQVKSRTKPDTTCFPSVTCVCVCVAGSGGRAACCRASGQSDDAGNGGRHQAGPHH